METSRYSNNDHSSYAIMPGCFNKSEPSLLQRRDEGLIRKDRELQKQGTSSTGRRHFIYIINPC